MIEVAEIFRLHGPRYRAKYADRMPHSHLPKARELLGAGRTKTSAEPPQEQQDQQEQPEPRLCPQCGGELLFVRRLSPLSRQPP